MIRTSNGCVPRRRLRANIERVFSVPRTRESSSGMQTALTAKHQLISGI
jgi:hypothetical protein